MRTTFSVGLAALAFFLSSAGAAPPDRIAEDSPLHKRIPECAGNGGEGCPSGYFDENQCAASCYGRFPDTGDICQGYCAETPLWGGGTTPPQCYCSIYAKDLHKPFLVQAR
ncbi:hypothetical protein BDY21DRAFT_373527 [Lineolata rhizophorae]|uniref:Invertebrate defensins family profile domain-containing protein n=1 Tax=Lineolata rhizophorae TaxID=578093 RepID=A0A6A6NTF3_9PEZI|nr:hypothetical protein BDY21DRAFT_373527 [Lineolata rhizophorae]